MVAITHLLKVMSTYTWTAIDRLTTIWKSYISNKIKHEFLQTIAMPEQLYGYITWALMKCFEKSSMRTIKDLVCCFKQIPEAASYKTAVVGPLTSHLTNNLRQVR